MIFVLLNLCKLVILLICVLLGVAFITYFERKILGYVQIRKGPNKWGPKGIFQPFSDAIKLFSNEIIFINSFNFFFYVIRPLLSLFLILLIWLCLPSIFGIFELLIGIIFIFCCLCVGVYPALVAGWSSNSKYPLIGRLRVVAQTISYEVRIVLILLRFIIFIESYRLDDILVINKIAVGIASIPLIVIWFIRIIAELGRSPFDLIEGESELVSGFNTEYAGGFFALFFLAEYGFISFFCFFFSIFFLGGFGYFYINYVITIFVVVWLRGVVPRIRYDQLIIIAWKVFLPVSIFYFIFWAGLVVFLI